MANKILLVDDDRVKDIIMRKLLEREGFEVTVAGNVAEAVKLISSERYDVFLSDQHMPGVTDGLTIISAKRHPNPNAIAIVLTGFPEMDVAAQAILRQADEIIIKQMDLMELAGLIKHRIATGSAHIPTRVESVATLLQRAAASCLED
jgi:DNA-binding NtrC family response regulator